MNWIGYALATVVSLGTWGMLSKITLRHATWSQAVLLFGIAAVLILVAVVLVRRDRWTGQGIWLGALTGVVGVIGFVFYYLAVGRGPVSLVIPVIGIYPAVTAILSVVFLGERLAPLQVTGIGLALGGVLLVGLGG